MIRYIWIIGLLASAGITSRLSAQVSIPPNKRVPAKIIQNISAPPDQSMHMPSDVVVDSKGRIFIADGANDRILRFTPQGKMDVIIEQANDKKLNHPLGLTIDPNDQLWVADSGNHQILRYTPDGKFLEAIPLPKDLPDSIAARSPDPTDLVITPNGKRCYIVDNNNHRILIRENTTNKWKALGRQGRSVGQFHFPFMVCIGTENYVYVSEAIGARIQRIAPSDRWSGLVGSWGVELGQLFRPKGVTADAQGKIFISDSVLQVIQVYGPWGRVIGVLCDEQGKPLRFQHPMGLCFDRKGRLYVVELGANRLAIVSPEDPQPTATE